MKRLRFSIAGLLGLVAFAALAVAALRTPTDAWDGAFFGLTLVALLAAVLLAVHRRDLDRSYWLGFALFGGVYLAASLIPATEARLPTTKGLALLNAKRVAAAPGGLAFADFDRDGQLDLYIAGSPQTARGFNPQAVVSRNVTGSVKADFVDVQVNDSLAVGSPLNLWASAAGTSANFVRIGHSTLALVMAFLGGHLSRYLDARGRRRRGDSARTEVPRL